MEDIQRAAVALADISTELLTELEQEEVPDISILVRMIRDYASPSNIRPANARESFKEIAKLALTAIVSIDEKASGRLGVLAKR